MKESPPAVAPRRAGAALEPAVAWARPRADALAAALLFGAALLFYYPLVFLGRAIVDYDAFVYFYPQRAYLAQSLLEGRLPLWNPYLFMGAPFLANPQAAVLYPLSWLFVVGPVDAGYTLQLVLHTFLGSWFTYLLARHSFGVSPLAAAVGGLAFGFGGFVVGQAGHLNQVSAAAWLPAILLAYDRAVALSSPRWTALGALALALQVLAGHPQETYMTLIALGLFGLFRAPWTRPRQLAWAVGAGALVLGLGVLVAAAQLVPTLELMPLSIRGGGVAWQDAVAWSLPPFLLPRALFPPFWLNVASTEYLGYSGVVPLTLSLLAVVVVRSRFMLFGVALAFVGLFLAPGENNASYAVLFQGVPGFDTFRVPARWLFLWQTGVALVATLGADWIGRGARVSLRQPGVWAGLLFVSLVLAAGLQWQLAEGEPFGQRRTPLVWGALAAGALATGFLANLRYRGAALGLLALLTAIELWAAADASPVRQAPPAGPLRAEPPVAAWLRTNADRSARVLSVAQPSYIPADETRLRQQLEGSPRPILESAIVATKWRATLNPNVPLQFGVRSADGYDGGVLPLWRFVRFATLAIRPDEVRPDGVLQSRLDEPPGRRVLDTWGVQYLLVNQPAAGRGDGQTIGLGDLALLARAEAVPNAQVIFGWSVARDDDEVLVRLAGAEFDPTREVVLTPEAGASPQAGTRPAVDVRPSVVEPERWQARVSLPAAGYLLQREAWYPGWRARVDGVETPVVRADLLFRAIPLAPGDHTVEVYFEPGSFRRGAILSASGLVGVALLLAWPAWRRRLPIIRRRGGGAD